MEDDKKTKDTNENGKNKIECPCGGYFLKTNYSRHLKSNMHKKYLDSNFVCVTVRKRNDIHNEDGLKIIKSKGRPANNIPEYHKIYTQNPENKKKREERNKKIYETKKKALKFCLENNINLK